MNPARDVAPTCPTELRRTLLVSVAAGALLLAAPGMARAQTVPPAAPCNNVVGTTVTCTGNVATGVAITSPAFTVLNVNTLTADITPAAGKDGLLFAKLAGDVTVNVDLTRASVPGSITVTGTEAAGIYALSWQYSEFYSQGSGDTVTVVSTGNITAQGPLGDAIYAKGHKDVSVTSTGRIQSTDEGIVALSTSANATLRSYGNVSAGTSSSYINRALEAISQGGGKVTVTSVGDVSGGWGINAISYTLKFPWEPKTPPFSDSVVVSSTGNITATDGDGISASGGGTDPSSVTSIGNISASRDGIDASVGGMTLTSTGNITAGQFGIYARGGKTVSITGNVSSQNRTGIHIEGFDPDVVINRGNGLNEVTGKTGGVFVKGIDGATVEITGIVTSASGNGIDVRADDRPLILNSLNGTVTANGAGIFAYTQTTGGIDVANGMTVVSQADDGIRIRQVMNTVYPGPADDVIVRNTGTITAFADGIDASVSGSMTVESSGSSITTTRFSTIKAYARNDLTITNSATLTAGVFGSGIDAESDGVATVTNAGVITAGEFGIRANADLLATITNDADITATNWAGIQASGRSVTVDNTGNVSALGDAGIEVTGFGASSADVTRITNGAAGQSGQIDAQWQGIYAEDRRFGQVAVTNFQDIHAGQNNTYSGKRFADGIRVKANSGDATVESTGKIESDTAAGIRVETLNAGNITITARGEIESHGTGIYTESFSGNHSIVNEAAITAAGSGIRAVTSRTFYGIQAGEVEITNKADITADGDGISVNSGWFTHLGADITIANTGSILAGSSAISVFQSADDNSALVTITSGSAGRTNTIRGQQGIATNTDGRISITNFDNIHAENGDAIRAYSRESAVTVATSGTLTGRSGVEARSRGVGDVDVVNTGLVNTRAYGIFAMADEGAASVDNRNDVTVADGSGIGAYSWSGTGATLTNTGNITAGGTGLSANGRYGTVGASITNSGDLIAGAYGIDVSVSQSGVADVTTGSAARAGSITAGWAGIRASTFRSDADIVITSFNNIHAGTATPFVDPYNPNIIPSASWHGISAQSTYSGAITIESTGSVKSDTASGIYAQNFAFIPNVPNYSGTIRITSNGPIESRGAGIWALGESGNIEVDSRNSVISDTQSGILTGSKDGDIEISASGLTVGATGSAAVQMGFTRSYWAYVYPTGYAIVDTVLDGASNRLTIASTGNLRNAGGIDQLAVLGRSGNEAVTNSGTVTGNVDLGTGTNSFDNLAGGLFNMGSTAFLGAGHALTNSGTLSPGGTGAIMTTTLTGELVLNGTSLLDFDLGEADVPGGPLNDLINVSGNLTLDGNVAVKESPGGSFTIGVYRLINYGGALTDNGLSIFGALPNGLSGTIQTSIANQVNLVVAGAPTVDIAYWDGPNTTPGNVEGGRGGTYVWNSPTNWTTAPGNANSVWDSGIGVFGGVTGTVTVENTQAFVGLQFVTDDYLLQTGAGGALNLGSGGFIHVDTGLVNTTMQVGIEGTGALLKQGDGRLVLTGTNTHAGGTAITAGTLAVGSNAALGTGTGSIADGATLQAAAGSLTVGNAVTVAGISTIDTQAHDFTLSGQISGAGTAHKTGTGTLNLSATGSAIGGLDIAAGGLTNAGTVGVSGGAVMGTDTVLTNRAGAELTAAGNVTGDAGAQAIDNAGTLEAAIDLGGGDDRYHLRTSGTQAGDADGGAGLDALALNAGPLARTIAEGDFVNFETVTLNGDAGASGRIVLSGATAPATQATLDAGSSGLASLQAGELNLATSASSLRTGILTTAAGTALSGNGTIFGNLAMAGFISPGNSIGTLTVDGDYVQVGAYDVEISHLAGAAPGLSLSDQIVTSGAVSFGGTVAVSIDAGSSLAEIMAAGRSKGAMRWRILDGTTAIAAGQRTAALQVPAGLAAALDYANGGQDVDLFMAWAAPPEVVQQAGLVWQVALRPDRALCDESTSGTPQRSCAFVQGGALRIDDDRPGGSDANDWSGMAGGGAQVRPDLWLGLAAGYREGELGGADYDRVAGHVWGAWTPGAADLRGFAGIGYYDVEGNRATTSGGTASWDYGAWQPFVAAEARYWVDVTRTLAVTPLAGLTSVWLNLPRHGETGAGIENFNVDAQTLWGMTALLGAEARWRVTPQLTLEASAGWQHLFGDDAVRITGGYAGSPGVELSGRSAAVDRDSLALGLAMLMPLDSNAMLRLDYDAEVNAGQFVQSGFARLTMGW